MPEPDWTGSTTTAFHTGSGTTFVGEYAPFVQLSENSVMNGVIEVRMRGREYKFRDERRYSALW